MSRIVAVCCAKNEGDLLEPLVRHTLTIVDRMIVQDDGSRDDSLAVLCKLVKEGLPLEVIESPAVGKQQQQRMTRLVCEAGQRLNADWIVALDADEFLGLPEGQPLIPADASPEVCLHLPWRGYVCLPGDPVDEPNPVVRMSHRRVEEPHPTLKVIVPGSLARLPGARVEQGNHRFWIGDQPAPAVLHPYGWLGHFPIRSAGQYLTRSVGTSLAYLSMPNRHPDWGWSCREAYEAFRRNPEGFAAAVSRASRQYGIPHAAARGLLPAVVKDPLPYRGAPVQFTPLPPTLLEACSVLFQEWEHVAIRYSLLLEQQGSPATDHQPSALVALLQSTLNDRDRERSELIAQRESLQEAVAREVRRREELEATWARERESWQQVASQFDRLRDRVRRGAETLVHRLLPRSS